MATVINMSEPYFFRQNRLHGNSSDSTRVHKGDRVGDKVKLACRAKPVPAEHVIVSHDPDEVENPLDYVNCKICLSRGMP